MPSQLHSCSPRSPWWVQRGNPNTFPIRRRKDAAPPPITNGDAGSFGTEARTSRKPPPATTSAIPRAWAASSPPGRRRRRGSRTSCTMTQISDFYAACLTPPILGDDVQGRTSRRTRAARRACSRRHGADVGRHRVARARRVLDGERGRLHRRRRWATRAQRAAERAYSAAIACRQASCNACWAAQGNERDVPAVRHVRGAGGRRRARRSRRGARDVRQHRDERGQRVHAQSRARRRRTRSCRWRRSSAVM